MSQIVETNLVKQKVEDGQVIPDRSRTNLVLEDRLNGQPLGIPGLNIDHIITEDDRPVDNIPSEKQQRLLTEPLYSNKETLPISRPFLVVANVGLFYEIKQAPIVPDVFLSLGVTVAGAWWEKRHRSYFVWEQGKVPEVVIEIVSNKEGDEDGSKLKKYEQIGVMYYIIFDEMKLLSEEVLRVYELAQLGGGYQQMSGGWLKGIGLGVTLWQGEHEDKETVWLRWCDEQGQVIPTGRERAEQERQEKELAQHLAEQERQEKEQERQEKELAQHLAQQERQRNERLLAQLKALGIEPQA